MNDPYEEASMKMKKDLWARFWREYFVETLRLNGVDINDENIKFLQEGADKDVSIHIMKSLQNNEEIK